MTEYNTYMASTMTVGQSEYLQLKRDSAFLEALYAAGVDGWEGYAMARDFFSGEQKKYLDNEK